MNMVENGWTMYTDAELKSSHDLVQQYAGLVKKIAHHLKSKLPPSVQIEDLIQAGMIGLLEAANNYDDGKGASFETYAGIRVRGSMLDEIRKGDWAPRSVHRNTRKIADAIREVENKTGMDAKDKDVAELLGVTIDDYHHMIQDSVGTRVFGFEDIGIAEDSAINNVPTTLPGTLDKLQENDCKAKMIKAIHYLPERERLILALYYEEELSLKEVGDMLGVSESRISQLHTSAMDNLQARMKLWKFI